MYFKDALSKLQDDKIFAEWKSQNEDNFLCFGFIMPKSGFKQEWQIGYYDEKKDKITSFTISDTVSKNPESEVFRDGNIKRLDLDKVKLNYKNALDKALDLQRKHYSVHVPEKNVMILQNLNVGQVWNITFVTKTFKTINIKVNSYSGNIEKHGIIDFFKIDE